MSSSSDSRMNPDLAARFEREALPHRGQLMRAALQLTRHRQDAEDLVQEAITRACAGFHRFSPGTNVTAWLHRILLNTFITGYRKGQREPVVPVAAMEQLPGCPTPAGMAAALPSAEETMLSRLPADRLVEALQELPAEFRQVLYLIDVEGFSYRETAALMNTPLGTVMSRLHRARSSLRARLTADRDSAMAAQTAG